MYGPLPLVASMQTTSAHVTVQDSHPDKPEPDKTVPGLLPFCTRPERYLCD